MMHSDNVSVTNLYLIQQAKGFTYFSCYSPMSFLYLLSEMVCVLTATWIPGWFNILAHTNPCLSASLNMLPIAILSCLFPDLFLSFYGNQDACKIFLLSLTMYQMFASIWKFLTRNYKIQTFSHYTNYKKSNKYKCFITSFKHIQLQFRILEYFLMYKGN